MLSMVNPGGVVQVGSGTVFAPNNNRVIYVHHSLPSISELDPGIAEDGRTSIPAAIDLVRTGRGDIIQLLPGHTESISSADYMSTTGSKTDFTVRGPATGAPAVLTWTVTGSSWLLDTAGVVIDGRRQYGGSSIHLNLEPGTGTVSVAAPITVSASRCAILGTKARTSTDSNNLATIPISFTDDADDCEFSYNRWTGATTGESTCLVDVAGADRLVMVGNFLKGASSHASTTSVLRFKTTAAVDIYMKDNAIVNKKASSTGAVLGVASVSGVSINDFFGCLDTSATLPWLTSSGLMHFREAYISSAAGDIGIICTPVST